MPDMEYSNKSDAVASEWDESGLDSPVAMSDGNHSSNIDMERLLHSREFVEIRMLSSKGSSEVELNGLGWAGKTNVPTPSSIRIQPWRRQNFIRTVGGCKG